MAAALLEAIARDALSDPGAARRALERALDVAEPDLVLFPFLIHPAPGLLERHARDCAQHADLLPEILSLLPGERTGHEGPGPRRGGFGGPEVPLAVATRGLTQPLSQGETRVLRYLPTNLSTPQIARELRQDGPAAVVDRRCGPGGARRADIGRARGAGSAALLAVGTGGRDPARAGGAGLEPGRTTAH